MALDPTICAFLAKLLIIGPPEGTSAHVAAHLEPLVERVEGDCGE
ncbi:hypothetical protein [Streptomyces xanthophaeus]